MTSNNININFRSIKAFKNISDSAIKSIENNAEYLKFDFGYPIISPSIKTERVFVILSGEARFIHRSTDIEPTTISKLGTDSFLGLSSLFKNKYNNCTCTHLKYKYIYIMYNINRMKRKPRPLLPSPINNHHHPNQHHGNNK